MDDLVGASIRKDIDYQAGSKSHSISDKSAIPWQRNFASSLLRFQSMSKVATTGT